jgi:hypothetical protein
MALRGSRSSYSLAACLSDKSLIFGGPDQDRTDDLFHAMEAVRNQNIDGKALINWRSRQNWPNRLYLLPKCPKFLGSGPRADLCGVSPNLSSIRFSHGFLHATTVRHLTGLYAGASPCNRLARMISKSLQPPFGYFSQRSRCESGPPSFGSFSSSAGS